MENVIRFFVIFLTKMVISFPEVSSTPLPLEGRSASLPLDMIPDPGNFYNQLQQQEYWIAGRTDTNLGPGDVSKMGPTFFWPKGPLRGEDKGLVPTPSASMLKRICHIQAF